MTRFTRFSGERGLALFVTMSVIALLLALTASLVMATSVDARIAAAYRNGLAASAAADAAAHRALIDLGGMPDWTPVLQGVLQSTFADGPPAGVRRLGPGPFVDLDLIRSVADCAHAPPCSDAERDAVSASRPWGTNNPHWQLFAYGPLDAMLPPGAATTAFYVVVLVADDPGERDGNPERDGDTTAEGGGVIRLRAEAFGPAGAHRAAELLVARATPLGASIRVLSWRGVD